MVLPAASFDATASVRAVAEEGCTSLYGTPTMFIDMLTAARSTTNEMRSSYRTHLESWTKSLATKTTSL